MRRTLLMTAAVPLILLPGLMSGSAGATEPPPPDPAAAGGGAIAIEIGGPGTAEAPPGGPLDLVACLREHGIDIADPVPGGGPVVVRAEPGDSAEFDAAVAACPPPGPGTQAGEATPIDPTEAAEFAQCMRDNGVPEFPRPDKGAVIVEEADGLHPGDAAFDGAQKTCEPLLPPPPAGTHAVHVDGQGGASTGTAAAGGS
jgi:hypothetical protein